MPGPASRPFDLTGQLALVTGSSVGLGNAIAAGLAAAGARIVLNARDRSRLDEAAARLSADGAQVEVMPFDVADSSAVTAGVAAIEREHGPIDILVNNAGVNRRAPLEAFSDADWRAVMGANLDGPFHVTRAALPAMKARRRGKIVNVCSMASEIGRPDIVPYAASKGGLQMFTRALAVELAPFGIQVNGIAPGFFATAMNHALINNPDFDAWVRRRAPAGRWGDPGEIAGAAVFLASPAASYVTGHILFVDGGFTVAY